MVHAVIKGQAKIKPKHKLSYQCGEEGHMSRSCPKKTDSGGDFFGGGGFGGGFDESSGGGGRRGGNCYKVSIE